MNPPPPPPHGESPKSTGLPPGRNFDIFIIPPHSAGSGFIYLPSLKPNVNSFIAGFATALVLVVFMFMLAPAFQIWWHSVKGLGGMGTVLLMMAIGLGAWLLGRIQSDGGPGPGGGGSPAGGSTGPGANGTWGTYSNGYAGGSHSAGPAPGAGAGAGAGGPQPGWQHANPGPGPTPNGGTAGGPKQSWQRDTEAPQNPEPQAGAKPTRETPKPQPTTPNANPSTPNTGAKSAWEKAREETRRREEEKKAKELEKKKKEELEQKLKEAREAERKRKEELEKRLKEAREKEAREREEREKKQKEEADKPKGSTYAFSAVGEKTNPWPRGHPSAARSQPPSPTKRPPAPTARTYLGTEDDTYSYRPYDKPKKPPHKKSHSSLYSESSYAASQSTTATSPPPSQRGPYSTKDPDKIVIKAVYAFSNGFLKTPTSQLVSGVGSVTDGLILRITTEGLFIDDDVRGVPQREWDVKAWTMKLVEVWCPFLGLHGSAFGSSVSAAPPPLNPASHNPVRRLWGMDKSRPARPEETDALLTELLVACRANCRLNVPATSAAAAAASTRAPSSTYSASTASDSAYGSSTSSSSSNTSYSASSASSSSYASRSSRTPRTNPRQTGELKSARLHVVRATIRDQEGKRYVFILSEEESWKVAMGLQRLRKGSQVRALGVSGMSSGDARGTLESLGWA